MTDRPASRLHHSESPLDALLEQLLQEHGEGPTVEIRPYDTGRFRVWAWVPGVTHDGMDEAAQGSGNSVQDAARVAHHRLRGLPVCAWCDMTEDEETARERWVKHLPSGAWTCRDCEDELNRGAHD